MNTYNTPIKNVIYKYGVSPFQREGDWVCNYCHNLNFAFRKKCNRCKMQTRQENQQTIPFYYPYNQVFYPSNDLETLKDITNSQGRMDLTPPRRREKDGEKMLQNQNNSTLPSVSPLVKRYRSTQQERKDEKEEIENNEIQIENVSLDLWSNQWEKDFNEYCEEEGNQEAQEPEEKNEYIEQLMNNIFC